MPIAINYSKNKNFVFENNSKEILAYTLNNDGNNLENVFAIEDRKEAIIKGSKLIGKDDCLLILGKGHEETQEINGNVSYFSDYEVINEIYN